MSRFLAVLLFFGLVGAAAAAPTITVRSGEHETFSRLVMQVPEGIAWSIDRGTGTATLNLQLPGVRYDVEQVFERIPRTRLTGVSQQKEGGPLNLSIGCDCDVVGFRHSGALLVIDIADPVVRPKTLPFALPHLGRQPYRFSTSTGQGPIGQLRLPITKRTVETTGKPHAPDHEIPENGTLRPVQTGLNISEQRLLRQIGRAADQGLLEPIAPRSLASGENSQKADTQTPKTEETVLETDRSSSIGVFAETVIDRDMSVVAGALKQMNPDRECLDSDRLALHRWGNEGEFASQVGELRSTLFGEFDRVNSQAVSSLAKVYLRYGFGTEARDILSLDPQRFDDHAVLIGLAEIMDDRRGQGIAVFSDQQNCSEDVALWAVLSYPGRAWDANRKAVLQAFVRLPRNLRALLGPRLSRIFTDSGDVETAAAILRAIDRSDDETGFEQELAAAEIDRARGQSELAVEKMSAVMESTSQFSPKAIVEMIDTLWRERLPIADDVPVLAAALAVEYRGTELGPELRRVHAVSQAMSGDFPSAYKALAEVAQQDSPMAEKKALIPVLYLLTESADDLSFLKFSFWKLDEFVDELPVELEEKLARRMLDLGFPGPAFDLLAISGLKPASPDRKLMRAEAALNLDLPNQALVELLSLSGPQAARLRAEALSRNGEFQLAGQVMLDADLSGEAARWLWLGDTWSAMPKNSQTKYDRLAKMSKDLEREAPGLVPEPPLARAQALLKDSQVAREKITELLGSGLNDNR